MYNFSITPETFQAITCWLDVLSEFDFTYEKIRIGEIKTRGVQQKALRKNDIDKEGLELSYKNIEAPSKNESLSFEVLVEYVNRKEEDLNDDLETLSETINYFIGTENDNSIDFLK